LAKIESVLATPNENSAQYHLRSIQIGAHLAANQRQIDAAARGFESVLAAHFDLHRPPVELANAHLDFATTLLALGHLDLALFHAQHAFELHRSVEGLAPHLALPFYRLLASIAVKERRYDDALAYVELAHRVFDPVQILDNRLAPFTFLEAEIWSALDRTKSGRTHARSLAQRALRAYQDWDAGAQDQIDEIQVWLRSH
jgi:tetratricopeptide (TPR) repeat protein